MKKRGLVGALAGVGMVIAAGAVALFPSLAGAHHNTVTGVSACADESGTYPDRMGAAGQRAFELDD